MYPKTLKIVLNTPEVETFAEKLSEREQKKNIN